jgi:hypothetical protein
MEERIEEENALNGMKNEMTKLSEALANDGGDFGSEQFSEMLDFLVQGKTADFIINHFEIEAGF